ncbi:MAG: ArsR family transcriptional regulator [Desulfovibrio sp.]
MGYSKTVTEHMRLTIVRLLAEAQAYTLNESLLVDLVGEYGFNPSRDRLRTELAWLEEQDLIQVDGEKCKVARLRSRGLDVAKCRVTVPGVKKPNLLD